MFEKITATTTPTPLPVEPLSVLLRRWESGDD
jgi:hypothetical protein